jgi:hypothetical protein
MPDRWAVTAIHKDAKGKTELYRCVKLYSSGHPSQGPTNFTHDQVAAAILGKHEFLTAFADGHGGLRLGAPLEIMLKTRPDATPGDNLEDLPTF